MKIIKRDRPQTVPFGKLKRGDEFRFFVSGSRCMRTTHGWVFLEGDFKGDDDNEDKSDDTPVYPDPPREAEKVRLGDVENCQPFEVLEGGMAKLAWRVSGCSVHVDVGDVRVNYPERGTWEDLPADTLVTPLPDATLEY